MHCGFIAPSKYFVGNLLSLCLSATACAFVSKCAWYQSVVCAVKRCCQCESRASELVLRIHSHFISWDTRLPDPHAPLTTHSALSAAAHICQLQIGLYRRISWWSVFSVVFTLAYFIKTRLRTGCWAVLQINEVYCSADMFPNGFSINVNHCRRLIECKIK